MHISSGLSAIVALVAFAVPTSALNYNVSLNSQTHLAYAGPHGMMVSWNTYEQLTKPTVKYGLTPNNLNFEASSTVSVTYNTSLTYNNHVKITGLHHDTTYYYKPTEMMESDENTGPFSFRTSRRKGDTTPYSIAVVVDMGTFGPEGLSTTAGTGVSPNNILQPGEKNTIQSLTDALDDIDFVLHRRSCAITVKINSNFVSSWRHCLCGCLGEGGKNRIYQRDNRFGRRVQGIRINPRRVLRRVDSHHHRQAIHGWSWKPRSQL
jgi:Purple acid Phosphatase, N-terminal domain